MWILFTLLAVLCWAVLNTIDSLLVRHFEDRSIVICWFQSMTSVPIILIIGAFWSTENSFALLLLLFGALSYMGDLYYWRILGLADASSSNFVGVFVTIIMTIVGVSVYGDTLTPIQVLGAFLVCIGIATLSFSRTHALSAKALLFMLCAAVLYSIFYIAQKWSTNHEQTYFSTFYWMMLGREFFAIFLSTLLPTPRRQIIASFSIRPLKFYILNAVSSSLFLVAMYCISSAYAIGKASYVAILGNIQPFVVILVAWVCTMFAPDLAPRELLTARSLRVKITSFSLVFIGLALLGSSSL